MRLARRFARLPGRDKRERGDVGEVRWSFRSDHATQTDNEYIDWRENCPFRRYDGGNGAVRGNEDGLFESL